MEVLRPSEKRSRLAYFSSLSDEKLLSVAVDSVWLCQRIPSNRSSSRPAFGNRRLVAPKRRRHTREPDSREPIIRNERSRCAAGPRPVAFSVV